MAVQRVDILGVKVDDVSEKEAVRQIVELANDKKKCHFVITVNSEFVMLAKKNPDFARVLERADLSLADGVGVVVSKLILGGKEQSRITGVDLVEKLSSLSGEKPITIGFLGGFSGVAKSVSERQKMRNPRLKVAFAEAGEPVMGYDLKIRDKLAQAGRMDILFVAYGMGKQEYWIDRNRKFLNVGVAMGVGGAFDYLAGKKRRAPKFLQNLGLEWLWRLMWEPQRIWRMRVLPVFAVLVLGQWFLQTWIISKKISKNKKPKNFSF